MSALLALRGLSLEVGGQPLVTDLDVQIHSGERWCVIGRNASGKSTLLRALAGLSVPHLRGELLLEGDARSLRDATLAARLRAYMPQTSQDRFALRVADLLALQGDGALSTLQAVAQALDVHELLQRPVTELSGGERQRVALAAVALQRTALWLLDEPVSFQDPAHQRQVSQWLCAQTAQAIVMSAHDMGWVQRSATHVLALQPGGGWRAGPLQEVLTAQTLRSTFACDWRQLHDPEGGPSETVWVAA